VTTVCAEIVASEALGTVELRTKSLWIVPELWKNAKGAFSHKLVGRAQNARPHAPQADSNFLKTKTKRQEERKDRLRPLRRCLILSALA
jgi:hypothetical protein